MVALTSVESVCRCRIAGRIRGALVTLLALVMLAATPLAAWGNCKPKKPLPRIVLKSMGPCAFDPERLEYAGRPAEQAACLLRPVAKRGRLGPVLDKLRDLLADRVGRATRLPSRESLAAYLSAQELVDDFGTHLWQPIARANDNDSMSLHSKLFDISNGLPILEKINRRNFTLTAAT